MTNILQFDVCLMIVSIPSGGGVGIMNFPRVTKGNFNSSSHGLAGVVKNKFQPRKAEPRVVGIEIALSDK